eukprot:7384568-Prymnesium_polylepis.1
MPARCPSHDQQQPPWQCGSDNCRRLEGALVVLQGVCVPRLIFWCRVADDGHMKGSERLDGSSSPLGIVRGLTNALPCITAVCANDKHSHFQHKRAKRTECALND